MAIYGYMGYTSLPSLRGSFHWNSERHFSSAAFASSGTREYGPLQNFLEKNCTAVSGRPIEARWYSVSKRPNTEAPQGDSINRIIPADGLTLDPLELIKRIYLILLWVYRALGDMLSIIVSNSHF